MGGTESTRRQRPREVAHALLDAVLRDLRALDEALADSAGFAALSERDRALVRHLTATTLRRLGHIDALLADFIEPPLPDRAASARNAVRLGAADILFLRTPAH
ncbi:MAG: SAM-dependent methyltransferase, partial [Defluviicoccus sp.]|nr:SAM-dependent methyltransferase [Defluviicoccus sp.]